MSLILKAWKVEGIDKGLMSKKPNAICSLMELLTILRVLVTSESLGGTFFFFGFKYFFSLLSSHVFILPTNY